MARRYGQYCGMAHALDLVGERWTLLIVRDLLVAPKRFTALRRGLPGVPSNILSARLRELEEHGLVQRVLLPRPEAGVVYALTPYGADLEPVVMALGVWGARSLGAPAEGDSVTVDSLVTALRTTFQPDAAVGVQARVAVVLGDDGFTFTVSDGRLTLELELSLDAPLIVYASPILKQLMTGEVAAEVAVADGLVAASGDLGQLALFGTVFRIGEPVAVPL